MTNHAAKNASRRNRLKGLQRLSGRLHLAADLGFETVPYESQSVIALDDAVPEVVFQTEVATTSDEAPLDEVFDRSDLSQVLNLAPADGDWFEEALFIGPDFFDETLVLPTEASALSSEFSYLDETESLFFVETHSTLELESIGVTVDEVTVEVFAPVLAEPLLGTVGIGEGEFAVADSLDAPIASVDLVTFATEDLEISFSKITPLGEAPQESVLVQLTPISEAVLSQEVFASAISADAEVRFQEGFTTHRNTASSDSLASSGAFDDLPLVSATLTPNDATHQTSTVELDVGVSVVGDSFEESIRRSPVASPQEIERVTEDSSFEVLFNSELHHAGDATEAKSELANRGTVLPNVDQITLGMDQLGQELVERLFASSPLSQAHHESKLSSQSHVWHSWEPGVAFESMARAREAGFFGEAHGIETKVILGEPLGRFDALGSFDLFAEWRSGASDSESRDAFAGFGWWQLDASTKVSLATLGIALAAFATRRPKSVAATSRERKLAETRDRVFGSSTDLDETLRAVLVA